MSTVGLPPPPRAGLFRRTSDPARFRRSLERTTRQSSSDPTRSSALQLRLKELLVFELHKDGGREYRMMTLRALYNHVLKSISFLKKDCAPVPDDSLASSESLRDARASVVVPPPRPDAKRHQRQSSVNLRDPNGAGITYRERLGGYIHPRDMRRLVTPFSNTNEPELIVRRHVMLLNFDPLRAIVLRDRLLVLVPDGSDSILGDLEARVRGGMEEMEKSVFGSEESEHPAPESEPTERNTVRLATDFLRNRQTNKDKSDHKSKTTPPSSSHGTNGLHSEIVDVQESFDEFHELNDRHWIDLPFELQCVDAVLQSVVSLLSADSENLQLESVDIIESLLDPRSSSIEGDSTQETLRRMKNSVGEMSGRVQGFIRAMNQVLDEEEDLALMNLSRLITHPERFIQPVPIEILHEESDEPELILESYLQQGVSIANGLDLLRGIIGTTSELVSQKLDSVRNRLLYVNSVVSILTFCVAVASLVGSYFGMNLENGIETDPDAFKQVVAGTTAGVFVLGLTMFWFAWTFGALPKIF